MTKKNKIGRNYCHQNWWYFCHLKTHQFHQITEIFTKIGDKKKPKLEGIIVIRIGDIFVIQKLTNFFNSPKMSPTLVKSLVKIQYQIQITKICENVGENSIENECGLLPHVYIIIQVPVLKDGDFVLTESVAMLRYLAREKQVRFVLAKYYLVHLVRLVHMVHLSLHDPATWRFNYHSMWAQHRITLGFDQVADHWYPKESQAQARVDEYLEWQHLGTRFISQISMFNYHLPPPSTFYKSDQVPFKTGSTAPTTLLRGGWSRCRRGRWTRRRSRGRWRGWRSAWGRSRQCGWLTGRSSSLLGTLSRWRLVWFQDCFTLIDR